MQVLIVDTDNRSAEFLRGKLSEITDSEILCISKPSEALLDVEEGLLHPEICFIDLRQVDTTKAGRMTQSETSGGLGGINLAARLQQAIPSLQIIFISEYDSFYLDVYEVEHVWFLHKPIDSLLLRKAWLRAVERFDCWERRTFTFRFDRRTYRISLRDILYFEKDRRKIILHVVDQDYCFYGSLDELMPQLDHHFFRCHNSYVVNINRVETWTRTSFGIEGHKIPISRQYAKAAEATFLDAEMNQLLHHKR